MALQFRQLLKFNPATYVAILLSSAVVLRALKPLLQNGEAQASSSSSSKTVTKKNGRPGSKTVLVFGSTGRVGSKICEQLVAMGLSVCGTTRSVPNTKLESKGVTPIQFKYGDINSAEEALRASDAQYVYIITDFMNAAGKNMQNEINHGKIIIDAIKKVGGVEHVIFQSVGDADKCPDTIEHFKSKLAIEKYLAQSELSYSILRPVAFLENFDDPASYNGLTKGYVKGLWPAEIKLKMVACVDIANAACKIFQHPKSYKNLILDCASCEVNGKDLSDALSEVSGVPCQYAEALPRFVMRWFMKDLHYMVQWFISDGYSASIDEFKVFVPNALGAKEWFASRGKWANGEKFAPK
jgi:uncharacterized protein YbjT (DUF2867 family)